MKITKKIIFLIILSTTLGYSQNDKSKIGIQLGNNLSFPNEASPPELNEDFLLRYSIGFIGRQILKENIKFKIITPTRKGEISLDYGLNFVFKGYHYKIEELSAQRDELTIEVPIQISFQDRKNVFMSTKLLRKGVTTNFRMGLKGVYNPNKRQTKVIAKQSEHLKEDFKERNLNLLATMGGGLIKNHKNGNVTLFEVAINLGLYKAKSGEIHYENTDTQITRATSFYDKGTYLSVNMIYLIKRPKLNLIRREKKEPIKYNPRF